jgi:hypothetical protein
MQVGSLVTIKPAVAPPHLYGIGLVVKVERRRCFIKWSTMPDREAKSCERAFLELVSASR